MGVPVFILGQSGTGKSASLRNFKSDEILLINVMRKPLPFRGRFAETYNGDDYKKITETINASKKKSIVVDDAQYLMSNEFMRRALEKGYDKFTEIGFHFWTLVDSVSKELPYDVIVYFLMHTDQSDNGSEKAKTIGRMLDEKICLEGMTSIVLKTAVKDGVYTFTTQNNGHDTVKSPLGMFQTYEISNDLKAVDSVIRKYWELDIPFEDSREIMAAHDAEVDAGGVSTEAPKPERSRRRRTEPSDTSADKSEETDAPVRERRRRRHTEAVNESPDDDLLAGSEEILSLAEQTEEKPRTRRRRARTE